MFFLVKLKSSDKLLVPQKWIKGIANEVTTILNYGIHYLMSKVHTVFVSPDFGTEPDFDLPLSNFYNKDNNACHEATIVRCFGKKINFKKYRNKIIIRHFCNILDSFEDDWKKMKAKRTEYNNEIVVFDDSDIDELQAMLTDEDNDELDIA